MSGEESTYVKKGYVRIYVEIPRELDEKLRNLLPMRKGVLARFLREAIEEKLERELKKAVEVKKIE